MFDKTAAFYDAIYSWKDYPAEAARVHEIVTANKQSEGRDLLDVACGTGAHLLHLRESYACTGLDLDSGMLEVARARLPGITFHQADMTSFDLSRRFDVVVCLFSSIGYTGSVGKLELAVQAMSDHLKPGGVLLIEPWFSPEQFHSGTVHATFVDQPDLKIARMNVSRIEGDLSFLDFHYLIATPQGIEHFTETHVMYLFTADEYRTAFEKAGLDVRYDEEGIMRRGLYIGLKPAG